MDWGCRHGVGGMGGKHAPAERRHGGGCWYAGTAGKGRGLRLLWLGGGWRGGCLMLLVSWGHVRRSVSGCVCVCVGVWVMGTVSRC